jgi:hypothetical protein
MVTACHQHQWVALLMWKTQKHKNTKRCEVQQLRESQQRRSKI